MTYTKNKTKLADACGVSREGLYGFMKKPGWPAQIKGKGWAIEDCTAFVLRVTEKDSIAAKLDTEIGGLKKDELFEKARKLKILNDIKMGEFIRKQRVADTITKIAQRVRQILRQTLENEYPTAVAGMDVPQARIYGKRLSNQILKEFQDCASEWN